MEWKALRGTMTVMAMGVALLAAGCSVASHRADFKSSNYRVLLAAETEQVQGGRAPASLSEEEVQAEVDRLLALKPRAEVPRKAVIYAVESAGPTSIQSPMKWLELHEASSREMKQALQESGVFEEVDYLPEILLPPHGPTDLKTLRIAAARAQADTLLIYATEVGWERRLNAWALLYPTIAGYGIFPGNEETYLALSKAVLMDVGSGYMHALMEVHGRESVTAPAAEVDREELEFDARMAAIEALAAEVGSRARQMQ